MTQIILNKLSGEDKSAKVGKLLIKIGQDIRVGDGLFNAESAKGNFLIKSEYEGTIQNILIEEGQQVKIGVVVAEIDGAKVTEKESKASASYRFGLAAPKKEEIHCDVAIIGGGPGGYVSAIRAAQLGAKVVLIEKGQIGGTCLNSGCIPTKCLVKSAHLYDELKDSARFGIKISEAVVDLEQVVKRKNDVVANLSGGIRYLLERWNIRLIEGEAKAEDKLLTVKNNKIEATIQADAIILATGSSPAKLNIPGVELPGVLTNEEILNLKKVPGSLTIIGGGVIGMEFAFIFNSFGTKVTVIEYLDDILFNLDEDLILLIKDECRRRGIQLYTGAEAKEIAATEDHQMITVFSQNGSKHFAVSELVLMSVGRRANLSAIDLEALGVELNDRKNGIQVNSRMATTNPSVYAIGDVTGKIQLAHVASHQGIIAAENLMGKSSEMEYQAIPSAVFLSPEIGVIGLCEKEAIKEGISYQISKFPFSANGKALSQGEGNGFVKILYSPESYQILGAAVVGPGATDLISNFSYHITNKTNCRTLHHMVFAHPTTAESVHEAILGITGEAIHFA